MIKIQVTDIKFDPQGTFKTITQIEGLSSLPTSPTASTIRILGGNQQTDLKFADGSYNPGQIITVNINELKSLKPEVEIS